MNYIDRINLLKKERRITNEQLSKLSGVPIGTLGKLMAGITDSPKLSNIISICNVLECSLDYLVFGKEIGADSPALTNEENIIIKKYRALDSYSKDLISTLLSKEYDRSVLLSEKENRSAEVLEFKEPKKENRIIKIPLYDLPVSAGTGTYLDSANTETVAVLENKKTENVSFAVKVSGNSMEPEYSSGDILLVEANSSVEEGELGIFVLDGEGYFKKFGKDRLISLNPEYKDIMLANYNNITCRGKVIGKAQ